MNKELIYQIREEYKELHKIAKGDLQEIEELEQQPVVQRYKYLFSLKDALARVDDCYIQAHIMGEIINKYGNGLMEPTNKLWFWFFDVTVGQYEKMFEKELEETDKDRMVCVYLDLENAQRVMVIPIEEQDAFEAINKVIRGKRSIFNAHDRYFNTRYEYFNLCISEGQDVAIKTLLSEEDSQREEMKKVKKEELKKLEESWQYNLISQGEYEKRKKLVLAKK